MVVVLLSYLMNSPAAWIVSMVDREMEATRWFDSCPSGS